MTKRTALIQVRVTAKEKRAIQWKAHCNAMSVSEWLRAVAASVKWMDNPHGQQR